MALLHPELQPSRYGRTQVRECIIICTGLLIFALLYCPWIIPLFLFLIASCLFVYRDPKREIPHEENLILCPVDGKVTSFEEIEKLDYGEGVESLSGVDKLHVLTFSPNLLDARVTRMPFAGSISHISTDHTFITLELPHAQGVIGLKLIPSSIFAGSFDAYEVGTWFNAGEAFGMVTPFSKVKVLIPMALSHNIEVEVGDIVRGGSIPLGRLLDRISDANNHPGENEVVS